MQYHLNIFPHTPAPEAAATTAFLNLTSGVIASLLPQSGPTSFEQSVTTYKDQLYNQCADNHNPANHLAWCLVKLSEANAVAILDNNGIPLPVCDAPQQLQFSWGETPTTPAQQTCMAQYGELLYGPLRMFHSLSLHQLTISCRAFVYSAPHLVPDEGVTEAVVARYALELAEQNLIHLQFGHKSDPLLILDEAIVADSVTDEGDRPTSLGF